MPTVVAKVMRCRHAFSGVAAVRVVGEDHVWFEDRWMVASLCDE
jgi:hypothetical protein